MPSSAQLRNILRAIASRLTNLTRGKEVRVLLDFNAFKRENEEVTSDSLLGEDMDIRAFPQKLKIGTLLRLSIEKLPTRNATYLIRPGVIEVTTTRAASPKSLLKHKVAAAFKGIPLEEAMRELADQTGASVVLDARAGGKLKQPVTATFHHDVSLGAALRMLADTADLELVVLDDGFYITTAANARRLRPRPPRPSPYLPLYPSEDAPRTSQDKQSD